MKALLINNYILDSQIVLHCVIDASYKGMCFSLQDGATSLRVASFFGYSDIARALIEKGATIDYEDHVSQLCISLVELCNIISYYVHTKC